MNTNSPHALHWKDGHTLLQPIVEKYRLLFLFFFTSTSTSIQSQHLVVVTSWQLLWVIHSYLWLVTETVRSHSVSWGLVFIMTERMPASMLAKTKNGANEKQQVSLLKEEMWNIISLVLRAELKVIWTLDMCVCVCLVSFYCGCVWKTMSLSVCALVCLLCLCLCVWCVSTDRGREITACKWTEADLSDITTWVDPNGQESQLELNRVYQLDT